MKFSFIGRAEVIKARGCSLSHQLRDEESGRYPKPIKVARSVKHVEYEIEQCMAAELNGATDQQMRSLVDELAEKRKALMPASLVRS